MKGASRAETTRYRLVACNATVLAAGWALQSSWRNWSDFGGTVTQQSIQEESPSLGLGLPISGWNATLHTHRYMPPRFQRFRGLSGLSRCSARLGRSACLDIDCLRGLYGLSGLPAARAVDRSLGGSSPHCPLFTDRDVTLRARAGSYGVHRPTGAIERSAVSRLFFFGNREIFQEKQGAD